jgi:hypothetical protein
MRLRQLMAARPNNAGQLHRFVRRGLGLDVPRQCLEPGHDAPFAYLAHAFFEGASATAGADCVVWANRGGGKTLLGAVATALDLLFKPGIQVRILGGSLAQSAKMYAHLSAMFDRGLLRPTLATAPTQRRIVLTNGSCVEMLAQSQKAVRGLRVHKLRCDEVELFDADIWQAAQLVTRSGTCGEVPVVGSVEALSTMHRPGGLMEALVGEQTLGASEHSASEVEPTAAHALSAARRVFRWNALDVIAPCPPERPCEPCVLWSDCRGRAKEALGFIAIDDLVAQWHRTSADTWQAEMLCRRPRRADCVYPNFEFARHVQASPPTVNNTQFDPQPSSAMPAEGRAPGEGSAFFVAGMDFGLRSPTVWLWAQVVSDGQDDVLVHVVDEYQDTGRTLEQHLQAIARPVERRGGGLSSVAWVGIDPAGRQRSSHTGLSDVEVLRRHGLTVRARTSPLRDGIERVRRRLDRGTLMIHPRCTRLIEAMRTYHFDANQPQRDQPVKDGPDHACDALRYMILNLEQGPKPVSVRQWA